MPARKTPPSVVKNMTVKLGAHVNGDEFMLRGSWLGLASSDQVRPGASHSIFDDVGQQRGQKYTDKEPENGDMGFVETRSEDQSPSDDDNQGPDPSIQDVLPRRNSLDQSVRILLCVVIQREHAMKWLQKLDLEDFSKNNICKSILQLTYI